MKSLTIVIIRIPLSLLKLIITVIYALYCYTIYFPYITLKTYIHLYRQRNTQKHLREILANIENESDWDDDDNSLFQTFADTVDPYPEYPNPRPKNNSQS